MYFIFVFTWKRQIHHINLKKRLNNRHTHTNCLKLIYFRLRERVSLCLFIFLEILKRPHTYYTILCISFPSKRTEKIHLKSDFFCLMFVTVFCVDIMIIGYYVSIHPLLKYTFNPFFVSLFRIEKRLAIVKIVH